jgi:hypothetical protein
LKKLSDSAALAIEFWFGHDEALDGDDGTEATLFAGRELSSFRGCNRPSWSAADDSFRTIFGLLWSWPFLRENETSCEL